MTAAIEGGEWSAARPGSTLPPEKTRYPFYRRLGGPQSRSGRAENLVPTGIRSRTVQPVVSRYTDWATRPKPNNGQPTLVGTFSHICKTCCSSRLQLYRYIEILLNRWLWEWQGLQPYVVQIELTQYEIKEKCTVSAALSFETWWQTILP